MDIIASNKVALIVGAGDALGGAIARRFAREGYISCIARRNLDKLAPLAQAIIDAGGTAHPFALDARREEEVVALMERIEAEIGPIEAVVFNVGGNVSFPIVETTSRVFFKTWQMACFAGYLTGREAARHMLPRGHGSIFFTGATASLRGRANFAAFASAKAGLRATAQSMARELGPQGIHVAHVVVDGGIDTAWMRENFPERYKLKERQGLLNPDSIAENYWTLHAQPRDAWTHELDLRPWIEPW